MTKGKMSHKAALVAALLSLSLGMGPSSARGQGSAAETGAAVAEAPTIPRALERSALPDEKWLAELERRAFPPAPCQAEGGCVQAQRARFLKEGELIILEMEYHAAARAGAPLPEIVGGSWERVSVQGSPALARALPSGALAARLEPGVSVARFAIRPHGASVAISFPQRPKRAQGKVEGWSLEFSSGASPASATLARVDGAKKEAGADDEPALEAPLFLSIDRAVSMEPSGSKVELRVARLSSRGAAASAWVDLQEGERLVGEGARVEGRRLRVDFAANEASKRFETRMAPSRALSLKASERGDRKESWTLAISPRLMVKFEGLRSVESSAGQSVFLPFPGQSLRVAVEEQKAAPGASVAVDKASLRTDAGEGGSRHALKLSARAAAASPLEISAPAGWALESAAMNGQPAQRAYKAGALTVDVPPGAHQFDFVFVEAAGGAAWSNKAPLIKIGAPTANLQWSLHLPASRWPLWVWGPALGPAILAWGALLVIACASAALGKKFQGPCLPSAWGWMAMLAPLAALHPLAALPVALFLLALSAKQSGALRATDASWNLGQFALLFLAAMSAWALLSAAYSGLLGTPRMMVTGNGSGERDFIWYLDRSGGEWMGAGAISAPIWIWRALMLAWALWLARAIVGRLGAMWGALCEGGLWRPAPKRSAPAASGAAEEPALAPLGAAQPAESAKADAPSAPS